MRPRTAGSAASCPVPEATAGPGYAIYHDRYQRTGDGRELTGRACEVRRRDTTSLAGSGAPRSGRRR